MSKKSITVLLALLLSLTAACGQAPTADPVASTPINVEETAQPASDQSNFLWQITLLGAEASDNLANTQTFQLYGGATEDVQYTKTAEEGYLFLLLNLQVDKNGTGGDRFSWSDVYVEDGQGNQFHRMENDVFLEDYDLTRLKSTDLTIGNNSGYICLEIPEDTDLTDLRMIHEATEGKNIIPIQVG